MKLAKKSFALLLCFTMLMQICVPAFAADGSTNLFAEVTATEAEVGDQITLTISNGNMTIQAIKAGFYFDNTKLQVNKITWGDITAYSEEEEDDVDNSPTSKTAKKKANTDGSALGVYAINSGVDSECYEGVIVTVIFDVIAEGEATITLREESAGTDAFKSDSAGTITITIGSTEPEPPAHECADENKDHVCDNGCEEYQGTHEDGDDNDHLCDYGCGNAADNGHHGGTATCSARAVCDECGQPYGEYADHNYGTLIPAKEAVHTEDELKPGVAAHYQCSVCEKYFDVNKGETTLEALTGETPVHTASKTVYTDNGADHTVTVTCACGHVVSTKTEGHTYENGKCVCEAEEHVCAHDHYDITATTHQSICSCGKPIGEAVSHTGGKATCSVKAQCGTCGAEYGELDSENHAWGEVVTGWYEINGDWYYGDKSVCGNNSAHINHTPVTGLTRVPYPTVAINGVKYAPDAEALKYCADKGTAFIDATEAWFDFDNNGKFIQSNGYISRGESQGKLVDGMLAWHPGLIEVSNGVYVYFIGDVVNGGNIAAEGDTYITKNNGIEAFKIGDIYNFADGELSGRNGIVDGKYYVNSRLMAGNGVTAIEVEGKTKYIYVRSTGKVVMDAQYYIPANDLGIVSALYYFDENGYMVEPKPTNVDGIVDGYYYVAGKVQYGAGLIELDGNIYYVRSNGMVATGKYYIIKTNDMEGFSTGDMLYFDEDGKMEPIKNGIVAENGTFYYYEKNHLKRGAGVMMLTDEEGKTFYIYVKSDGTLATGIYWPTTRNDLLERGAYDWGTDGRYYPSEG